MRFFYFCSSIFIVASFHADAQSFSLKDPGGSSINNGDTIVVNGTVDDQILEASIWITNNSSSLKTVMMRKTELSLVPGSASAFTWDLLEYAPFVTVSQGNDMNAATTDSTFLSFYFPNGFAGTSFIQYTFFDENNPADSAWVVVEYNVSQVSGITEIDNAAIKIFPNPVHSTITISSNEIVNRSILIRIYNSLGEIVYAACMEQFSLSIDASGFAGGCYMIEAGNERFKLMKQ